MSRRAVFLDRDGVINRALVRDGKPYPPRSLADLEILPEVPHALERLREAGFLLIVVTNQPDVARGKLDRSVVDAITEELMSQLPLNAIRVCFHDDPDGCTCRKPKPGLLLEAASEMDVDLNASYMVGDRWRDIAAGSAAGCKTILIERDYREQKGPMPNWSARNLQEAADVIFRDWSSEATRGQRTKLPTIQDHH